ncbi:MAG TPA: D-glucuronyl C5-epimerase family protein [Candidatus Binatia bacterium]|nr:D-glucuronyl C5-epimerase family protein [Candidatus Binatia bacterium]
MRLGVRPITRWIEAGLPTYSYQTSHGKPLYALNLVTDDAGVVMVDYPEETGVDRQYNPLIVAWTALESYFAWLDSGDRRALQRFFAYADWLVNNLLRRPEGYGVWPYNFPWRTRPPYDLAPGWVSAIAQGKGLSVLVRAYRLTGNPKYLETAQWALRSFEVPVESGGVRRDEKGCVWYEEYPTLEPSYVLNGFLVSLFGLYEYNALVGSGHAQALFRAGVECLVRKLPSFEVVGGDGLRWSKYDLTIRPKLVLFRFYQVDAPRSTDYRHPIDAIELINSGGGRVAVIDVGGDQDDNPYGAHLLADKVTQNWSSRYRLDGRSVRDATGDAGKYQHAPFFFYPTYDEPPIVIVRHKDVSRMPLHIQVYDGRQWYHVGILSHNGDDKWQEERFALSPEAYTAAFVSPSPSLTDWNVDIYYHDGHVVLLDILNRLAPREVFKFYTERWTLAARLKVPLARRARAFWPKALQSIPLEEPVLPLGSKGAPDSFHAEHPSVLYDGRLFRMWYAGYGDTPGNQLWRILSAESFDGVHWEKTGVVLEPGSCSSWDQGGVAFPFVLEDPSSSAGERYKMWYAGRDGTTYVGIGLAISPDGVHWTEQGLVLPRSSDGSAWDSTLIISPSVVKSGDRYEMWYVGGSARGQGVGYAASSDGRRWSKFDGNPILAPSNGDWDQSIYTAHVHREHDLYLMWYEGGDRDNYHRVGLAFSVDGHYWIRNGNNPVLFSYAEWNKQVVSGPTVLTWDKEFLVWHSGAAYSPDECQDAHNQIGLIRVPMKGVWEHYQENVQP